MKQGLNYVIHNSLTKTVILTDSQSPQLIQNTKTLNNKQITYAIQKQIYILATQKQTIMIPWIPSQKNIRGNEINNPMPVSQDLKYPINQIEKLHAMGTEFKEHIADKRLPRQRQQHKTMDQSQKKEIGLMHHENINQTHKDKTSSQAKNGK